MSFNNTLKKQFEDFNLKPEKLTDNFNHQYADYIELVALIFNGDYATSSNVIKRYKDEGINPIIREIQNNDEIGSLIAERNDEMELWSDKVFSVLSERQKKYKNIYPFLVSSTRIRIKRKLNSKHRIYLALLISANLKYFKIVISHLTSEFEEISFHALKNLLPSNANIKRFGKKSDYSGTAQNKITRLAKDLNVSVNEQEIRNILGTQERGLDLIGWIPFNDKIPNMVTILAQCACGKEWYKKQGETKRFESAYYNFYRMRPIHAMFIPYSLGKDSNTFFQSDEIQDNLIIDRKRILDNIIDTKFFKNLDTRKIVDSCIKFEEDIV